MRVVVCCESRLARREDGTVWTTSWPGYQFWRRYLAVFGSVRVLARVAPVTAIAPGARRVDGPGVQVSPLPYYVGPGQYLRRRRELTRRARDAVGENDAVILRVPSVIASHVAAALRRRGHGYALEVVGDPLDLFAPEAIRHPLRPLLRSWSVSALRGQCRRATGVAYVTREHLQGRYPAGEHAIVAAYSSVDLPPDAFVHRPRPPRVPGSCAPTLVSPPPTLVSVGSLAQPYKGIEVLIAAVRRLADAGSPVRVTHLGGGRYLPEIARVARRLRVADLVTLAGHVQAGGAVREYLDASDLFVLPSRTEGLPRALIEAMARGLPAVASAVGGVPELLDPAYLVRPGDPIELADRIAWLISDPRRLAEASARNLRTAWGYSTSAIEPVRNAFYAQIAARAARRPRATPTRKGRRCES